MSKKGFINLSVTNFFSGLCSRPSGGVLFFGLVLRLWSRRCVGGTQRGTALRHSIASQRQVLLRMCKRRVEFCSLSQGLIDSAELMRKIQENIYYKLLLNEIDLN